MTSARFTVSGSAGSQNGRRYVVIDSHDVKGGGRRSWHRTFRAAQRAAARLNDYERTATENQSSDA